MGIKRYVNGLKGQLKASTGEIDNSNGDKQLKQLHTVKVLDKW